MRAFLREPSTPWIVFDQEGRPPSQLAVGEVLRGPRRTLLSDYDFFPATSAVDRAPSPSKIIEPSSLSVSSDLRSGSDAGASAEIAMPEVDAAAKIAVLDSELPDFTAPPIFGLSRRVLGASAAGVALLSMLVVGTLALRGASSSTDGAAFRNAAIAQPATRAAAAAVPAEIPPPDLDVKPAPPAAIVAPSPAVAAPVATPTPLAVPAAAPSAPSASGSAGLPFAVSVVPAKGTTNKYTRFTIAGDARAKDVFMDGKRMLGRGGRSFSVMCGAHTISINVRNDPHEVDFPCGAELVVGK